MTNLISTSGPDGTHQHITGRRDKEHRKLTGRIQRKMQRQRDAALKESRARWVSQKTQTGRIKRRFRWDGKPSNSYLKAVAHLRRVEQKRSDSLRGIHHNLSSGLVDRYQHVCIEDTRTANMTRSSKGTIENPGSMVKQKSGLNRSILSQGWY